jgi:signal transduction histidine kinase
MSLKTKLIILLIITGILLVILFHTAFNVIMRPSLEDQKIIFIETLKKKIRMALSFEAKSIEILCSNWAEWEGMAGYVMHPSEKFEKENFPEDIFVEEDMVDLVVAANHKREIVYSRAYDRRFFTIGREEIAPILDLMGLHEDLKAVPIDCIVNTGPGPMMISAEPLFAGGERDRAVGALILGRFISPNLMAGISAYVMEDVRASVFDKEEMETFWNRRVGKGDLFYTEDQGKLNIYYLLRDANGKPAVVFHTQTNNRLFQVVNQHVVTFIVITLLLVILLGGLLYLAIQTQILRRVRTISGTMKNIGGLKDLSLRIRRDRKKDEISHLVASINSMLDKLQQETASRELAEKAMLTHGKLASIGRMASCIGHEVNNPLLAISNSIQVIKKISRSKSSLFKEAVDISETEISRIRDIISNLLDFHRLEREEFCHNDVTEIIHKSLDVLKWSKKLGGANVVEEFQKGCLVYGSPVKLKQVFMNFILNAVEAMENQQDDATLRIRVVCKRKVSKPRFVEVHFIDNGPGIPDHIKNYLFEPFVSTKEVKGVGLGLYISYKIIASHRGEIIYNDDYKNGTHFIIKLPQ